MAEQKKDKQTGGDDNDLRAGVSKEAEGEAKAEAKETFKDEAIDEAAAQEPVIELLTELPEDGVVPDEDDAEQVPQGTGFDAAFGRHYTDENVGRGGSYIIDPETGDRKRQYEAVKDDKGKTLGYRPVP